MDFEEKKRGKNNGSTLLHIGFLAVK